MSTVPLYLDLLGSLLDKTPRALKKLGQIETKLLKYDILPLKNEQPVFIGGLARAGSTILLEFLNDHKDCCSYHYGDYPFVHANYFWNTLKIFIPHNQQKIERAHKDGLYINNQSPEALDEIIWMSFFDHIHDAGTDHVLNNETNNEGFEDFYKDSLLKLLALRKSKRPVLKNNYYSARLLYLHKLYPDAKFIIPYRAPVEHIFSLIKQHKLVSTAQNEDPRAAKYMRRHGHFEFGNDFRPTNFSNTEKTQKIIESYRQDDMITAYSLYWDTTYRYIHETLENNPTLKENAIIIPYDHLTQTPKETLENLLEFINLNNDNFADKWAKNIKAPSYYTLSFTDKETARINNITQDTQNIYKKLCGSISI